MTGQAERDLVAGVIQLANLLTRRLASIFEKARVTPLATAQWIATDYTLALCAATPLAAWGLALAHATARAGSMRPSRAGRIKLRNIRLRLGRWASHPITIPNSALSGARSEIYG